MKPDHQKLFTFSADPFLGSRPAPQNACSNVSQRSYGGILVSLVEGGRFLEGKKFLFPYKYKINELTFKNIFTRCLLGVCYYQCFLSICHWGVGVGTNPLWIWGLYCISSEHVFDHYNNKNLHSE